MVHDVNKMKLKLNLSSINAKHYYHYYLLLLSSFFEENYVQHLNSKHSFLGISFLFSELSSLFKIILHKINGFNVNFSCF